MAAKAAIDMSMAVWEMFRKHTRLISYLVIALQVLVGPASSAED